jgi:ANTAR domain-containing protein
VGSLGHDTEPHTIHPLGERAENHAIQSLEAGSVEEASAAVGRLLAVTQATFERRAQLEHALQSRVAIEQAKGIIAERYGLGLDEAFEHIRRAARTHRMKLRDLVGAIRPGEETPAELRVVLADRPQPGKRV